MLYLAHAYLTVLRTPYLQLQLSFLGHDSSVAGVILSSTAIHIHSSTSTSFIFRPFVDFDLLDLLDLPGSTETGCGWWRIIHATSVLAHRLQGVDSQLLQPDWSNGFLCTTQAHN